MDSDSGVFSIGNGQLKDLALVAHGIDYGLKEIEAALSSIVNLLPSEENQPEALETMNSVQQEVQEIEEKTNQMLIELQKMLASGQQEEEKAKESNKVIEKGMLEMESMLEKFGYDGSEMPAYTPLNTEDANASVPLEDSESSEDELPVENEESDHSPTSFMLQKNVLCTPALRASRSRVETMAGAEITPLVLSSKLLSANDPKSTTKQVRVSPKNPYLVKSPSLSKDLTDQNVEKERLQTKSADLALSRPVRPVLSTVSFL